MKPEIDGRESAGGILRCRKSVPQKLILFGTNEKNKD